MALAALIFLPEKGQGGEEEPKASVLGLPVPVYQARHAARAGCKHVVLYSQHIGRAELHYVETMKSDGLSVSIARNPAELASAFHPDERIAMFAPGRIARQDLLISLLNKGEIILSVSPATEVDPAYRIDAQHAWAGLAVVPSSIIRMAGELPGDWAGELALLRIAIQQGALRAPVDANAVIDVTDSSRRVGMFDEVGRPKGSGGGLRALDGKLARGLRYASIALGGKAVAPAHLAILSALFLVAACLIGWLYTPVAALLVAGLGMFIALLTDQLAVLRLENDRWPHWLTVAAKLISAGLILLLGARAMQADGQWGNLALALWLLGQIAMSGLYRDDAETLALITAVATISLVFSPAWSLSLAIAATIGLSAWRNWREA